MTQASIPRAAAEWTRTSERGSLPLIRLMVWFSLKLGRAAGRVPLRIISAYFLVFGGKDRNWRILLGDLLRLRRKLGREGRVFAGLELRGGVVEHDQVPAVPHVVEPRSLDRSS